MREGEGAHQDEHDEGSTLAWLQHIVHMNQYVVEGAAENCAVGADAGHPHLIRLLRNVVPPPDDVVDDFASTSSQRACAYSLVTTLAVDMSRVAVHAVTGRHTCAPIIRAATVAWGCIRRVVSILLVMTLPTATSRSSLVISVTNLVRTTFPGRLYGK